ncbi:MAG: glycosyltransferase family 2 protein, partial [Butyricicoccus sp.]
MAVALSVIIPAYNAVEYIEACVESIIAGTFHDLEVLLIDDGSTDGTGPLCDRLAEKYTAVRVFHTDNRGLAEARNLGIEHAAGQYIGFADADDTVAPNMFESMVKGMSEDVQLVVCRYLRCQEKEAQRMGSPVNAKETVNQAETMERLMKTEYGAFVWNKLFRKEILQAEHIRFPQNCRATEDLFFTWEYVQHCKKAVFLDVPLYFYIMRSGSIMNTFRQSRTVVSHY